MLYNKKDETVTGSNIYLDKKNRTVYYQKKTQKGYVITPGTERTFYNLSQRYIIGAVVFIFIEIFLGGYFKNPIVGVAIGAVAGCLAFLFMYVKYRGLLNTYPMIQNFDYKAATLSVKTAPADTKGRAILKVVLYVLLAILFIANAYMSPSLKDSTLLIGFSYVAAVVSLGLGIKTLIDFTKIPSTKK